MVFLNQQLLYLAPVAALVAGLVVLFGLLQRERIVNAYGQRKLIGPGSRLLSRWSYLFRAAAAALGAALLLVALARPVVQHGTTSIMRGTVDVVTVVDVSRSMAAMDYSGKLPSQKVRDRYGVETVEEMGTRLEMVRHLMNTHVMPTLQGNQLGVVSYAGNAFPQAFLTHDQAALTWVLDRGLTISSAPGEGSHLGTALALALDLLEADSPPEHEKVILLFSDGGNDDEAKLLAAVVEEIKKRGIRLVVVGMGHPVPSPIPVKKLAADDEVAKGLMHNGKKWYENEKGEVEKSALDPRLLMALAQATDGRFVHLQNASDLNLLEFVGKNTLEQVPGKRELFPLALTGAFILLLVHFAAARQWRKRASS